MSKEEFLQILQIQLSGELSQARIAKHIQYYEQYIASEMAKGRSEEEIITELGAPGLIAKTLIDTRGNNRGDEQTYESLNHPQSAGDTRRAPFGLDLSTWYGKALLILGVVLIFALVVTVLSALLPFLLIAFVIGLIMRYFKNRS